MSPWNKFPLSTSDPPQRDMAIRTKLKHFICVDLSSYIRQEPRATRAPITHVIGQWCTQTFGRDPGSVVWTMGPHPTNNRIYTFYFAHVEDAMQCRLTFSEYIVAPPNHVV